MRTNRHLIESRIQQLEIERRAEWDESSREVRLYARFTLASLPGSLVAMALGSTVGLVFAICVTLIFFATGLTYSGVRNSRDLGLATKIGELRLLLDQEPE